MELLKRLKTKSILGALPLALILAALGAFMLFASNFWLYFTEPADLWDVPRDELEGKYVTVDLECIYGSYAYTETYRNNIATGNITEMEYVIDANEDDYCGLVLSGDLIDKGDALMEDTFAYYNYEIDEITSGFTVTGVMKSMPEDSLEYYYEWFEIDAETAEAEGIYLPLYLDATNNLFTTVMFVIFGIVLMGIGLVPLFTALSGRSQKQIREKAKQLNPNAPDYILSQADELYQNQKDHKTLKMDSRLIIAQNTHLYATAELVWAYHSITRHRVYGIIPAGKTHSLTLAMLDGKRLSIGMKNEAQVMEWLQRIQKLNPNCILGYNDSIQREYRNSPSLLAQKVAAARAPQPQQPVETDL